MNINQVLVTSQWRGAVHISIAAYYLDRMVRFSASGVNKYRRRTAY
jgi:hypothetical protein